MSFEKDGISDFVSSTRYENIPEEVNPVLKRAILDYLGVTLAGSGEPAVKIISQFTKELEVRGGATVIGGGFKTRAWLAAMVNGAMAHGLEYDDTIPLSEGYNCHPSVVLLPAVLGLAEEYQFTGKDILAAYSVGFEVEARIGSLIGKQIREAGWHPTSVLGTLGAAAASSNLLRLSSQESQTAIGIAGSLACGLTENTGTMTKSLHAGNAAKAGILAALFAQKGFSANPRILEGRFGFCGVFDGKETRDSSKLEDGLGSNWAILSPGLSFKPYPSGRASNSAIEAMLFLKEKYSLSPQIVEEITCKTNPSPFLKYHRPQNPTEAMFSLEYCLAIALIDGEASLGQFKKEKVLNPEVQAFLSKVKCVYPEKWHSGIERLAQEVTVKLRNGTEYSHKVIMPKGEPQNPMTDPELIKKFEHCAWSALSPTGVEKVSELISKFDSLINVSELTNILGSS